MKIERVWCIPPNKYPFLMKPIARLLRQEMASGGTWLDPMAGMHSPAHITNDINPDTPCQTHLDAVTFLEQQPTESMDGVLFDPPWGLYNVKFTYNLDTKQTTRQWLSHLEQCRRQLYRILKPRGKAITVGWSTKGIMPRRFMPIYRILIVVVGHEKDVLVTCQRKVQTSLF